MRLLDRQAVVLAELRTRASIVLSAVGIVTALMGSEALKGPHPHILGLVGIGIVALVFGLHRCIAVLWPVGRGDPPKNLTARLLARLFKPESRDGLLSQVALDSADLRRLQLVDGATARTKIFGLVIDQPKQNYQTIGRRTIAFSEGRLALIFQVLGWSAALLLR